MAYRKFDIIKVKQLYIRTVSTCVILFSSFNLQATTIDVVTEYLPPFQIKMPDDTLGGYATEVITELFKLTGDTANTQVLPWARAYEMAKNNKNTLIYSIAHTKAREAQFHWVGSLKFERFNFWGLKSKFKANHIPFPTLKLMSIASSNEYNSSQYLKKMGFINIYHVVRNELSVLMLEKERVDIILSNELVLKSLCKTLGFDFSKLQKLQEAIGLQNDLSIAFSLNTDPDIIKRYQAAYTQLLLSGRLDEIKREWLINDDIIINNTKE